MEPVTRQEGRPDATPGAQSLGSVFFIGNATVLIRLGDFTILTDPTFIHMHEQTWLGYGLHTTRLTNPAIEIEDLPPLDFVLLSHFHGDHFDHVAERKLPKDLLIVTTREAAGPLNRRGFSNIRSLETWESTRFDKGGAALSVTATPGRHGPPLSDYVLPDVMGSVLDFRPSPSGTNYRIYITGDTLVIDDLKGLPERFPDLDLALLHLGGTRVFGIMVTMDGRQGVELMRIVQPNMAIPIHFDDYDVFKSPLSDFQNEVRAAGLEHRVHYLQRGDRYELSRQVVADRPPVIESSVGRENP